ncbi:carbonic anhydrase [Panaeolus papilionaceus]|nr:carbonic anhydrase [Panaeolus papilionaceus]
MMLTYLTLFLALSFISSGIAYPVVPTVDSTAVGRKGSSQLYLQDGSVLDTLLNGHKAFKKKIADSDPGLLQRLADKGQAPPFMFLGCSDSRVNEATVFSAAPGTFFSQRNIANEFQSNDMNTQSVLSYAVTTLGVEHVIVMGHYGCGGVAASIASPPTGGIDAATSAVHAWIQPIRELFQTSNRTEIVELRNKHAAAGHAEQPHIRDPGFRALVEENVKVAVARIASSSVITNHFASLQVNTSSVVRRAGHGAPLKDVFIHGWVYDIETGDVADLEVSVGPPGKDIPPSPFKANSAATHSAASLHN